MSHNLSNKRNLLFVCCCLIMSAFAQTQRTSIGFYFGPSIGYNSVYSHNSKHNEHGLLDFSFDTDGSFFNNIGMLNDRDLSNNVEMINGIVFGVKASLPVIDRISIQPELQYEQLDFNHIVYQNGDAVFNDMLFALSGLNDNDEYKIANYFWTVHYINFPFVVKLYPTDKLFFQVGCKLGFLIKAEESRALARFNLDQDYIAYDVVLSDKVVYDFFESNTENDNHGFDINEWPFNWNACLITGFGYETKSFYFSLRYSIGLLDFFREIPDKDDDFFDNYNVEFDDDIFQSFNMSESIVDNNFKLHVVSLTIGYHISN